MSITSLNVANSILKRAFAENIDVTPMKLQKLIYCVYKAYLKETNYSLFEENFETWTFGPVVRAVYDEFKYRGGNPINGFAQVDRNGFYKIVAEKDNEVLRMIISRTWDIYKYYSGTELSVFTHGVGTAWRKAYDKKWSNLLDADIRQEAYFVRAQ
jgi:Uncharacterized phage-associated protein